MNGIRIKISGGRARGGSLHVLENENNRMKINARLSFPRCVVLNVVFKVDT